jgi:hypothetical protein
MILEYPLGDNGMYILRRSDMDDIANKVIMKYAPGVLDYPQPVPIGFIAEDGLSMNLEYMTLSLNGEILGATAFTYDSGVEEDNDDEILAPLPCFDEALRPIEVHKPDGATLIHTGLSGDKNHSRRRFTISHEVSHRILHRTYYSPYLNKRKHRYEFRKHSSAVIVCRECNIERVHIRHDLKTNEEWLEWQADSLAASLLMPVSTFSEEATHIIKKLANKRRIPNDLHRSVYYEVLRTIGNKFMVSQKATEIRLRQLGFIDRAA